MKYFIYGLYSTEDNVIRYIGQTKSSLKQRKNEHKCDALTRNLKNHKCNWIRKVYHDGYEIGITLIEETNETEWPNREIFWINQLKSSNNLVNQLDGGNSGGLGGKIRGYLSFNEAADFIKEKIPNIKGIVDYKKKYELLSDEDKQLIPKNPDHVYPLRGEWGGWERFLSMEIISSQKRHANFLSYEEAKKYLSDKHISSRKKYQTFLKENNISFLPYKPERTYENDGWGGYNEFLNK